MESHRPCQLQNNLSFLLKRNQSVGNKKAIFSVCERTSMLRGDNINIT